MTLRDVPASANDQGEDGAMAPRPTALGRFNACAADLEGEGPLERLRYFLSLSLNGQDWLDVEPFLDAIGVPSTPAAFYSARHETITPTEKGEPRIIRAEHADAYLRGGWKLTPAAAGVAVLDVISLQFKLLDAAKALQHAAEDAAPSMAAIYKKRAAEVFDVVSALAPSGAPDAFICRKPAIGPACETQCEKCATGVQEVAPVVPLGQFIEDFMATVRGERPVPYYAGKTVYATEKVREEAAANDGAPASEGGRPK